MKKQLILVKLNTDYCDYLRIFDNKVPYNFKEKETRPFVGVLFAVNDFLYFAPLSSPKEKHVKLRNKIDFLKLDSGKLGAINFNNMVPVTEKNIIKIDVDSNEQKYNKLLKEQLFWLNRNKDILYIKSKKLYDKFIDNTLDRRIRERCCNFILLEEKCNEYNNKI